MVGIGARTLNPGFIDSKKISNSINHLLIKNLRKRLVTLNIRETQEVRQISRDLVSVNAVRFKDLHEASCRGVRLSPELFLQPVNDMQKRQYITGACHRYPFRPCRVENEIPTQARLCQQSVHAFAILCGGLWPLDSSNA